MAYKRQRSLSAPPGSAKCLAWLKLDSSREELRAINFEIAGKLHVLRKDLAKATAKLEDVEDSRDRWMRSSNYWEQEALKTKIGNLEDEIAKLRVEVADKTELVKQVSELTANNKILGEAEAELKTKLDIALKDIDDLSQGKSQSDDQVRMMQAEVERVKGEVKRANDNVEATRQEVERAWIDSLNEDGDQLDTNPKFVQVVRQNVALTALNEQHEQTIAELTDEIKCMMMANDEQATTANHGMKREGDELSEDDKRGTKKLKAELGGKQGAVRIELYVYESYNEAFKFEDEVAVFLPDQGAFNRLEKICGNALPAPAQGKYTMMIKAENVVNHGTFDDVDRHRFHDWVRVVNVIGQEVRTCRYFAHIPDTDDAKAKAKAAAGQVKQPAK